jgi:carbonic anhydrase
LFFSQFHSTDDNAVSVLRYGLTGIKGDPVKEVRVVGHIDCGGVKAARGAAHGQPIKDATLARWLGPLTKLATDHKGDSEDQLAERNVRQQVQNVRKEVGGLPEPRRVPVNGYIYNVHTGELRRIAV